MPNKRKSVSKIDQTAWRSPLTASGHRLGEPDFTVQTHEVGCARYGREWDHAQVCSPYWRLYYNFEAGSSVRAGTAVWPLGPERVIVIPEGVVFDCRGGEGARHLWVHFTTRPAFSCAIRAVSADDVLRAMLGRLAEEVAADEGRRGSLHHWSIAVVRATLAAAGVVPAATHPRLRKVLRCVEGGLRGELSNQVLAQAVGLSVEAFIRWFGRETGRTPAVFVAEERVREAGRQLVFTNDSIEHIAEAVGFANRHHFTRVFTRYAGCAPGAFRRTRKP
ncbi:AraC family transcriptional regulator [Horticoccus luteus]|uniref:AraC family transcriptional regulator n=1 Tax=Horticoccus luteus TaxID=2862869 RepID=A0A8F9TZJ0_9BACT|nr:AraC family transcriptional regulator [Horticoccus luteus]QYM80387.1 AraC family transcriptional regulator [Horticoccus luteus]